MTVTKLMPSPQAEARKCEWISELLSPTPEPMAREEVERRRRMVELTKGRPFPRLPLDAARKGKVADLTALWEHAKLEKLAHGIH